MTQREFDVDAPTLSIVRTQGFELTDDDGGLIDVDGFNGQTAHAFGQLFLFVEHALTNFKRAQRFEHTGVGGQIPNDQLVFIDRVGRERPHHRRASALDRVHARDVQKGFGFAPTDLCLHRFFFAQLEAELPQPRLLLFDQTRQGHGGAHIGQRIVRRFMGQTVGGG